MKKKGYIHIYTGKGKGKSTAAIGIALRAAGWGMKTCIFQFLKKGVNGEMKAASSLAGKIKVITFDQTHPMFYHKSVRKKAAEALKKKISQDLIAVKEVLLLGNYDIVIMDEIINAINSGLTTKIEITELLKLKLRTSELIMTGRGAPSWLINLSDYTTDMRLVKHPYKKGLKARKGIEF